MSKQDVIKAWKDEEYRAGLSDAQRSRLPESPVGLIELPDTDLEGVVGGYTSYLCLGVGVSAFVCRSLAGTCRGRGGAYTKGCC